MYKILCFCFWIFKILLSLSPRYSGIMGWDTRCTQPRGDHCVNIRDCPDIYKFAKQKPPPLQKAVVQILRWYQCGVQGKYPYVCCNYETKEVLKASDPPSMIPSWSEEKVSNNNNNMFMPPTEDCGRTATGNYRIIRKTQTALNEYPWMALLFFQESDFLIDFKCSGTVINRFYILTAAHCVHNQNLIGIRLGEHNLITDRDCDKMNGYCAPPVQDRFLDKVIVHPNYSYTEHTNDIALIRLDKPASFLNENVQPICLPYGELTKVNLIGKYLTVSGWGTTNNGGGFTSSTLLQSRVPVVSLGTCRKIYRRISEIDDKNICAGGERGQDSCKGDSGGPLKHLLEYNDGISRYIQYGIVSYGPRKCGLKGYPSIYTNVAHYMDWILEVITS